MRRNVDPHFRFIGKVNEFVMEETVNADGEVKNIQKFIKIEALALNKNGGTFGHSVGGLLVPFLEAFKVASNNVSRLDDLDDGTAINGTAINVKKSFFFCSVAKEWKML